MDPPPPLPPHPTTLTATTAATTTTVVDASTAANPSNYPDSTESTPRAHPDCVADEPQLPLVPGAKFRLMCSYGGHIIPRPHDKSLCYVGGETRIVVVDRNTTLADLTARISRTLLDNRLFTLKYQIPNEDLDSLISVTTDEDLENMLEEYDRLANAGNRHLGGRLRLFLFLAKPETAKTMGALLNDAKSESWFVDALNGADLLPRGLSDSAAMDDLLSLDSNGGRDMAAVGEVKAATRQEMNPQQPVEIATTSSFDSSTTSSPSMANLPPIRVRVEEGASGAAVKGGSGGIEEQFGQQLRMGPPPLPTGIIPGNNNVYDDERSEQETVAPPGVGARKPPLPLQLQTMQHKMGGGFNLPSPDSKHGGVGGGGGFNLASPDSVTSDSSIASASSFSRQGATLPQEPPQPLPSDTRPPPKPATEPPQTEHPTPPAPDPSPYHLHPQLDQHQYIQPNLHYIHHPQQPLPPHATPPSYYPLYAAPPPVQPPHHHAAVDPQQYPVYFLPVPHNMARHVTANLPDATAVSNASMATANPPIYKAPNQAAAPEAAATAGLTNMYRALASNNPPGLVPAVPTSNQQQYIAYSQMANAAQPVVGGGAVANYGYEYAHQLHDQVYYTGQGAAPAVAAQYQSMTPAAAVMLAEASKQQEGSNQQMRT